jgi:hypothetical protein
MGMSIINKEQAFSWIRKSDKQLRGDNFTCDRILYIVLRDCLGDTILNVHAPTEERSDATKDTFYKELECVFDQFLKYHMKILLGDSNTEVQREDSSKSEVRVYMKLVMIMGL